MNTQELRSSIEDLVGNGRIDSVSENIKAGRSAEAADQLLTEVTADLHSRGRLPALVSRWGKDNHGTLDLDKDGVVSKAEIDKILSTPMLREAMQPLERQFLRYMSHNIARIAAAHDDWGTDRAISIRDLNAFEQVASAESQRANLAARVKDFYGQRQNFGTVDTNNDGYISDREIQNRMRGADAEERELLSFMQSRRSEIAKISNDQRFFETQISMKDIEGITGKYQSERLPESMSQVCDYRQPARAQVNPGAGYLPDLMLEFGNGNLSALDMNGNGFVTRDEISAFVSSPRWGRNLGAGDQAVLRNMDSMYEQVQRSHKDEWWYKDTAGITAKDLAAYADHQRRNRLDIPTTPGDHNLKLIIGGVEREYTVHIPPGYDGKKQLPVVYFFHYLFGDDNRLNELTGMNTKADKENFIVVYPKATGWLPNQYRQWNLNNKPSYKVDEIAFVGALMDNVENKLKVDRERVTVAGYSNGAMIANQVAAEFSDRVAALVAVSGCMTGQEKQPASAVPALIINGTDDRLVPYTGRLLSPLLTPMKPVTFARDYWARANGCDTSTVVASCPQILEERYTNSRTGNQVRVMTLSGYGHGWPGATSSIDGPVCRAFRGVDALWDFASQQRKPRR